MPARRWLPLLCLSLPACGPDPGTVPRTGIYDVTSELVASDCRFAAVDNAMMDAVQLRDDRLIVGFADYPSSIGARGFEFGSRIYLPLVRDAGDDRFTTTPEASSFYAEAFEWDGCRLRRAFVAELLAADVIQSHATFSLEDAGGCERLHAGQDRCEYVHETTFTLREACDGCDLATMGVRIRELWAEEHPLPK
jgi:hypothetical protein